MSPKLFTYKNNSKNRVKVETKNRKKMFLLWVRICDYEGVTCLEITSK